MYILFPECHDIKDVPYLVGGGPDQGLCRTSMPSEGNLSSSE